MTKRVLDVGNCVPDHLAVRAMIQQHFDAQVVQAHVAEEALRILLQEPFDLILINRKLDRDSSDGLELIQQLQATAPLDQIPVMMITNYARHQQQAIQAGAAPGFGKQSLGSPETIEKLRPFLE